MTSTEGVGTPNPNDSAHKLLERDIEWSRLVQRFLVSANNANVTCISTLSLKNGDAKCGKHHGGDGGRRGWI